MAKFKDRRKKTSLKFKKPSLTKQAFKDDTNINLVMARYEKTGQPPMMNRRSPAYGDFSEVTSYQDAFNLIQEANSAFEALPASIRREFDNDPAKFVEFAENPDNAESMVEMGLAAPASLSNEQTESTATPTPQEAENDDKTTNKSS